jgi:hypothetical protein
MIYVYHYVLNIRPIRLALRGQEQSFGTAAGIQISHSQTAVYQ